MIIIFFIINGKLKNNIDSTTIIDKIEFHKIIIYNNTIYS